MCENCNQTETKRKFKCDYCHKEFTAKASIKNHCLSYHEEYRKLHPEEVKVHKCEFCNKQFNSKSGLDTHLKRRKELNKCPIIGKGKEIQEFYICPLCNKKLASEDSLKSHLKTSKRLGKCPTYYKKSYKKDMNKIICEFCNKEFKDRRSLNRHLKARIERNNICPDVKISLFNSDKPSPHLGMKRSEETRQKLREINKGRTHTEETKRKLSEMVKGEKNPNYGKPGRKTNLGKKASIETRELLSKIACQRILEGKRTQFKTKEFIFPSGKIIKVQGYEHKALTYLLNLGYKEEDFFFGKDVPIIKYEFENNSHRYIPDFFILKENMIVEVKSDYTFKRRLEQNKQKFKSTVQNGFNLRLIIFKQRVEEPAVDQVFKSKVNNNSEQN